MSFPPSARGGLDLSRTTLCPVNGHIQSQWSRDTGNWSEPAFVEDPFLRVHGLAPVFNYGQEAYEGLKAFRSPDNEIHIIRPGFHAARLNQSAELVSIPAIPEEHFLRCVQLAVGLNAEYVPANDSNGMLYIRPVVFGSGSCIQLAPPDEFTFCVYVTPAAAYHGISALDALILEDFDRAAPRGVGSGKVGGNYAPVMRWSDMARKEGFAITLHLDSQTRSEIEEFSTSAFVGIKQYGEEKRVVVPDSTNIVNSVTSDSIQQLAKRFGWVVERRSIKYDELSSFDEVLACGTAVTVIPIKSITRKSTSDRFIYQGAKSAQGPCAAKISKTLEDIFKGHIEDEFGWLHRVERPAGVSRQRNGEQYKN